MKKIPAITAAMMLLCSCSLTGRTYNFGGDNGTITASDEITTKEISISDFTKLEISNIVHVTYTQGQPATSATISAPDNVIEYVTISNSGDKLKIGLKNGTPNIKFKDDESIDVTVSSMQLSDVTCSGVSSFSTAWFNAKKADFECSGASYIMIQDLSGGSFEFDVSGASKGVINKADATSLDLDASGASTVIVKNASCVNIEADASGASSISLEGSCDSADLDASGAASINARNLKCTEISTDKSGVSSINH